jgi:hypothetical protein
LQIEPLPFCLYKKKLRDEVFPDMNIGKTILEFT